MNKDTWFDIKLLTECPPHDNTKSIQSDNYGSRLQKALTKLSIPCNKLLHLGRNMGSKILDLLEVEADEIRRMGQWSPTVFDNAYSSKLPMGPMRNLAGYDSDSKIYFNTRTTIEPPSELLRETPIGNWVEDSYATLTSTNEGTQCTTAVHVLRFFRELNKIFLQDAAALLVNHPERKTHPIFEMLSVFHNEQFMVFVEKMRDALQHEEDPLDAKLENVIPGMSRWHSATNAELHNINMRLEEEKAERNLQHDETTKTLRSLSSNVVALIALNLNRENNNDIVTAMLQQQLGNGGAILAATDGRDNNNSTALVPVNSTPTSVRPFSMVPNHKTLEDMWNEWHGEGKYADSDGGIAGRNKELGSKWRKHLPTQHYSRTSRIIKMIESKRQVDGCSIEQTLAELQPIFVECEHRLAGMVIKSQELGYITKQEPRGQKRSIQDISTNNS